MNTNDNNETQKQNSNDANRDPITGAPGAHPLGAGVGAAGGAVTGAAIGMGAGPVGAAVGLVVGGVLGGLAGKGFAEHIDPSVEDEYWKTNYTKQPYVEYDEPYTIYESAYRTGYEGRKQYPGKNFEEAETELQRDYEKSQGKSKLSWEKAKQATRDAWNRVERALPGDSDGDGR